jgi:hypothetical protein
MFASSPSPSANPPHSNPALVFTNTFPAHIYTARPLFSVPQPTSPLTSTHNFTHSLNHQDTMSHQQNPPEHWNSYRPTYVPRPQQGRQSASRPRGNSADEYRNPNKIPLVSRDQRTRGEQHNKSATRPDHQHPQSRSNFASEHDAYHHPYAPRGGSTSSFRPDCDTCTHAAFAPIYPLNTRLHNEDTFPHDTPSPSFYPHGRETGPRYLRRCGMSPSFNNTTKTSGSSSEPASILPPSLTTLMSRSSRAYDLVINYARDCPLGTRWSSASIARVRTAGKHLHADIRVLRHWEREAGRMDRGDWDVLEQDGKKVEKLCKYVLSVISETERTAGLRGWRDGDESDMVRDMGYGGCGEYAGDVGCGIGDGQSEGRDVRCGAQHGDEDDGYPRYQRKYRRCEGGGRTDAGRAFQGRGDGRVAGRVGRHVLWR